METSINDTISNTVSKYFTPRFIDRFWSKVDKAGGADGCWLWTAATVQGYGRMNTSKDGAWKAHDAHRIAYTLTHGAIEAGLCVLHECDNRKCCNPAHLRAGTNADNVRDRERKGRGNQVKGERVAGAKLNEEKVREIKRRGLKRGHSQAEIAAAFGVSRTTVSLILRGETWRHVQ